jgi:hypothetical protein
MSSPLRTPQQMRPGSMTRSSSKSNKPPTHPGSAGRENRNDNQINLPLSAAPSPGVLPSSLCVVSPPRFPFHLPRRLRSSGLCDDFVLTAGAGIGMNVFSSPGMMHMVSMGTPSGDRKRSAVTHSPFREWATSELGCLGNEIDSPGQGIGASQSLLSPGYADMPVKMCVSRSAQASQVYREPSA